MESREGINKDTYCEALGGGCSYKSSGACNEKCPYWTEKENKNESIFRNDRCVHSLVYRCAHRNGGPLMFTVAEMLFLCIVWYCYSPVVAVFFGILTLPFVMCVDVVINTPESKEKTHEKIH